MSKIAPTYRVSLHEEPGDKAIIHWDCAAASPEDAMDAAESAHPGAEVLSACLSPDSRA